MSICANCSTSGSTPWSIHAKAAVKAGATEAEVAETLGLAVYMGAGPSAMYAAKALEAVRQFGVAGGDKPA